MKYCVYTPAYEQGYNEYGSDTAIVEAPNKKAALVEGVRQLRLSQSSQQSNGRSPFTGLKAEELV
uniref:Uncharacterized protein n=1 Tax=viral metagenome TaxID=1070528 RepID=A0A6H2A6M7_9ZZZZ